MQWKHRSRGACNLDCSDFANIHLPLSFGEDSNVFIEVLREPIVAYSRNVEYTDAALTDALPEPLGVKNASA